ncbi:hypothetical protein V2H45_06715 [Tumidithrix elongata RA019]|uniref:Uncharacterized protein n=1 Tax=Tumidithrix elongata BACA0141 TaxID=2716417 RepID=A0AAW9Q0Q8_9CYAN|nr:hypothetical protein [Tumidithrix elongata RA019]
METNHSAISQPFSLRDRDGIPLEMHNVDLSWDEEDGDVMSCQMTFEIDFEIYQQGSLREMFNHESELRATDFGEEFHRDRMVELEIILDDECLDDLLVHANTVEEAAKYLLELNGSESPLLETENWYLLYAKQSMLDEEGSSAEIVYRTHWASEEDESEDVGIETNELFTQLIDFFESEDWDYGLLEEYGIIKLSYKGLSGEWDCFALGNDLDTEIGFYSIYQENIPEVSRLPVSEFLTRANYGMPVGNFEIDLDSGEVRFKISVELGNTIIPEELLGCNVERNLAIADRFFPIIKLVASGEVSVMQAIALAQNLNFETN